jgi:hypothetical protein
MPKVELLGLMLPTELKEELRLEAWQQRLSLSAHVRALLERSRTPDGRARVWTKMRKRGRPKRY